MERRKSSKHNGPPTPWKRKPLLLQEDEVDDAPQQKRQVKRIKLRLSEGPASRPTSRDGERSLLKPAQWEGSSILDSEAQKESGLALQPLTAASSNLKVEEGSNSPIVGPPPPLMVASPTILTRIKAQPRNANERAMMQDIETLETMLQLGSYRSNSSIQATDPQPVTLTSSASHHPTHEWHDGPARSPPPLWAHSAGDLSQVTTLCPFPSKSKSKAKLSPVMVKSSRSGIARGLLLTTRPMVGQEVARKIDGTGGRWEFELVVRGRKGSAVKKEVRHVTKEGEATGDKNGMPSSSQVRMEDEIFFSSSHASPSPPPTLGHLLSQDPSSLALYRAWQHCTSLYLFLSRPCVCRSGSECGCSEQGGLSLLPCQLPENVGAVAVGWVRVVGAQFVMDEDAGGGASGTMKVRWYMQMTVDEATWWLPSGGGKAAASAAWTSTRPPSQPASTSRTMPTSTSHNPFHHPTTRSLLLSLPCPNCHLTLPRHHWSHYLCPNCSTRFDAYVPSLAAGDVDFGTAVVPTEGPRMDNGRAVWDKGRVRRELRVVQDGERGGVWKGVEYSWSARPGATAVASVRGPSTSTSSSATATVAHSLSLIHLLSSNPWTRRCKTHLSWLLAPSMPYERRTNQSNAFELEVALCSRSKRSKRKAHEPPLLELTGLEDIGVAHRLVELVEEVEQRVGVAAAAASSPGNGSRVASRAHLTVLGCDNVKHRLDLPQTGGVTYLHLGAPATLSVTTLDGVAGSGHKVKTMLNAMVVSGDVIWVPRGEKEEGVTVAIEAKALCVGMMLVE